ncbi:unnamed protein product [Phytophthora fragariaefolia]|uniref:Unnamed protein product n=1 Tax=Phytophthora fragariaefolia TaxID=1490495 RepID=A0A9W6Y4I2_9STRA|nr:unnamed protein product [Phytophthora fragariaefolia]
MTILLPSLPKTTMQAQDVDEALAKAAAILHATKEKGRLFSEDERTNHCLNTFCMKVLANSYAHYCEDRPMCLQFRALKLQCFTNAQKAAANTQERTDSFLTLRGGSSGRTQHIPHSVLETTRAAAGQSVDTPFVIPRRKRVCSSLELPRNVSIEPSLPRKAPARITIRPDESRERKRLRLGHGMRFTDVLAHFEIQDTRLPNIAPTSRSQTRGVESPPIALVARASGPAPTYDTVVRRADPNRGGGRYENSSRRFERIPHLSYKPQRSNAAQAIPDTKRAYSAPAVPTQVSLARIISHSKSARGSNHKPPPFHPENDRGGFRSSQETNRGEMRYDREHVESDRSHMSLPQACSKPYSSYHTEQFETRALRSRVNTAASPGHILPASAYRSQYDNEDSRIEYKEGYVRQPFAQLSDERDERQLQHSVFIHNDSNTRITDNYEPDKARYLGSSLSGQRKQSISAGKRLSSHNIADVLGDEDDNCGATFSFHDSFLQSFLSQLIRYLPALLGPVMNTTAKPRKMKWYIEYIKKIERACMPHLHVRMKNRRILVMVHNRVWTDLHDQSTLAMFRDVIKKIRTEAVTWKNLKAEVERSLEIYRERRGNNVDLSNVFTRAWNNLKSRAHEISLLRQSNYFRGSRLHHWNFVVGKVEIGSGSHEERREAFRLAAASAAAFLLGLDDGHNDHRWRPTCNESDSSESSEGCELMFVQSAESGPVAADALITISDSSSLASEDAVETESSLPTITPQNEQDSNGMHD